MKMWLLMALMFSILYGVITGIGTWMGAGNALFYLILAFLFISFQYLIGPSLVQLMMRVKWVSEREEPELHRMVRELAGRACLMFEKLGFFIMHWLPGLQKLKIPSFYPFFYEFWGRGVTLAHYHI